MLYCENSGHVRLDSSGLYIYELGVSLKSEILYDAISAFA